MLYLTLKFYYTINIVWTQAQSLTQDYETHDTYDSTDDFAYRIAIAAGLLTHSKYGKTSI